MSYASQSGRAKTSPSSPRGFGVCDRCGIWWNHERLNWQFDWRGSSLQNLRILVCPPCTDTPQQNIRAITLPADPLPIMNARVENFVQDETDYQTVTAPATTDPTTGIPIPGTTTLLDQDGNALTTQPVGAPLGLEQGAVMPLNGTTHYAVDLLPLSVTASGTDQITVTCQAPHGMATNDQMSVEGLSDVRANGFYSVTVTTATAFTYQTNVALPAGALLTSTTNMITALVGLPLGYDQIPQTGI